MNTVMLRLVILLPVLLHVSYTDWRDHRIANADFFTLTGIGFAMSLWSGWDLSLKEAILASLITLVVGFLFFLLGQGAGDAKLLTGIACLVGYKILSIYILSIILMGIAALMLLVARKINYKSPLPMAPAITLATILCVLL